MARATADPVAVIGLMPAVIEPTGTLVVRDQALRFVPDSTYARSLAALKREVPPDCAAQIDSVCSRYFWQCATPAVLAVRVTGWWRPILVIDGDQGPALFRLPNPRRRLAELRTLLGVASDGALSRAPQEPGPAAISPAQAARPDQ